MNYIQMRQNMVDGQLTPNRITDKDLLSRMLTVPRELFVEQSMHDVAYMDSPVSIKQNREMIAPLALATLLQNLELQQNDNLLILASGSGYSAALTSPLVEKVLVVEDDLNLMDICRKIISDFSLSNVSFQNSQPFAANISGEFDKILIDTVIRELPTHCLKNLKDGGKVAYLCQDENGLTTAKVCTRVGNELVSDALLSTTGSACARFETKERFVF